MGFILPKVTGAGGNANVPADAVILPPQAFVDNIGLFTIGAGVNVSSKGITSIAGTLVRSCLNNSFARGGDPDLDAHENSLTTASINAILDAAVQAITDGVSSPGTINISGQTPAAPPTPDVVANCAITCASAGNFTASGWGDYVKLPGLGGASVFWFNVDNNNTVPTVSGAVNYYPVPINSGYLDGEVAGALNSVMMFGANWAATLGGSQVTASAASEFWYGGASSVGGGLTIDYFNAAHRASAKTLTDAGWTVTTD